MSADELPGLSFHPLTPARWADLERLFGARGACGGCWCMWWRIPRARFEECKGEANRQSLRSLVEGGTVPGLLAYAGEEPIAWCAVEPRTAYPVLERSRSLRRVDDQPVWSVTCLFVSRPYRNRGVSTRLLRAAIDHVRERGGRIVEGYPVVPRKGEMPAAFAWTGLLSAFEAAGFREVARGSESRPIVRYEIAPA